MSVYISLRVKADPAKFEQVAAERRDTLMAISERAKQMGCIHHRFATSNGELIVMDEWDSEESFRRFFESDQDIPEMMAASGVTSEPEITFYRPLNVGDEF